MYVHVTVCVPHLCSFLAGVLASNGVLDAPAATKGAHFIRICSVRGTPLIFLQNTTSDQYFLAPAAGGEQAALKARAQMMATLSCSKVSHILRQTTAQYMYIMALLVVGSSCNHMTTSQYMFSNRRCVSVIEGISWKQCYLAVLCHTNSESLNGGSYESTVT